MEDNDEDQRLLHHSNPKEFVSHDHLTDIGVLYWQLDPKIYENDKELQKTRQERGYNYMDLLDLCHANMENYEQQLRNCYIEHIHVDEEIRYCLEESGYFDVRDKEDRWIQIWIKPGDLIILSSSIYHRFTLDTTDYIKADEVVSGRTSIPGVLLDVNHGYVVWNSTSFDRIQGAMKIKRRVVKRHDMLLSVRILPFDMAVLLFEKESSDLAVSSKKEEVKRGFTSAMMLPLDPELGLRRNLNQGNF
ncbi:1,2-dihydroxy-3-keto-5-methylthiopentene dioxygenase [Orobanche minor]